MISMIQSNHLELSDRENNHSFQFSDFYYIKLKLSDNPNEIFSILSITLFSKVTEWLECSNNTFQAHRFLSVLILTFLVTQPIKDYALDKWMIVIFRIST